MPVSLASFNIPLIYCKAKCMVFSKSLQMKPIQLASKNPSHKIIHSYAVGTVCVGYQPTLRFGGWEGAAAGADVLPNFRSHHAETILLNHFKASAIGVTARLNQLENAGPVSIPSVLSWMYSSVVSRQKKKKKCIEKYSQPWSWFTLVCQCLLVVHSVPLTWNRGKECA